MAALHEHLIDQFLLFALVLTRVSGLVMTAPIFGARSVPLRIRTSISVALAMMITPIHGDRLPIAPAHLLDAAIMFSREVVLGVALGLAMMILFSGLQLAGQILGQLSGISLTDVFDPTFETHAPAVARLLDITALSVFLTIGGHRQLLRALFDTFHWRPPGAYDLPNNILEVLSAVTSESFAVGIRAGAPIMVALVLAVLMLGVVSRAIPQLNILAMGFGLNAVVMLATLSLSLGGVAWLLQERSEAVLDAVHAALIEK